MSLNHGSIGLTIAGYKTAVSLARHALTGLLIACLLAGCQARGPRRALPILVNGLVAESAAGLVGKVKLPTGLVSNNGGGLVAPNSGRIVSDNGGGLRVLALGEEQPLAGARVQLLDAAGRAVKGADGQPLEALTAADGSYRFERIPAGHNLVVAIVLPDGRGEASALVPRGTGSVDVNLSSSLTSALVLHGYVRGSASPEATLDRLSADVEAGTRHAAAAALSRLPDAAPTNLGTGPVLQAVQALGRRDPDFARQLEAVRRVFVTAGTVDQGAGRPALELNLDYVNTLAQAADGAVLFPSDLNNRIWRLGPTGTVETLVGRGKVDEGSLEGKRGPEAGLDNLVSFGYGPDGRLWILEEKRLSRLDPDGLMHDVWLDLPVGIALQPLPDGGAWVLTGGDAPTLWHLGPDGARKQVVALTGNAAERARMAWRSGLDAQGRLWLAGFDQLPNELGEVEDDAGEWAGKLDPASGTFEEVVKTGEPIKGLTLAADGTLFLVEGAPATRLVERRPDGSTKVWAEKGFPPMFALDMNGVLAEPGGSLLVAPNGWEVFRLAGGGFTKLAGLYDNAGADADKVGFSAPAAVTVRADGTLVLADDSYMNLYLQQPGGPVERILDTCYSAHPCVYEGPAADTGIGWFLAMAQDAADVLYLLDYDDLLPNRPTRLRTLGLDNRLKTLALFPDGLTGEALAVDAAGTAWITAVRGGERGLYQLAGNAPRLVTVLPGDKPYAVAAGLAGEAWLACAGKLWRWQGDLTEVKADERLTGRSLAIDARGRLYTDTKNGVLRFDPANGSLTAVAGPGSRALAGSTIDDSLSRPRGLFIARDGSLHLADGGQNQFKRVAVDLLDP